MAEEEFISERRRELLETVIDLLAREEVLGYIPSFNGLPEKPNGIEEGRNMSGFLLSNLESVTGVPMFNESDIELFLRLYSFFAVSMVDFISLIPNLEKFAVNKLPGGQPRFADCLVDRISPSLINAIEGFGTSILINKTLPYQFLENALYCCALRVAEKLDISAGYYELKDWFTDEGLLERRRLALNLQNERDYELEDMSTQKCCKLMGKKVGKHQSNFASELAREISSRCRADRKTPYEAIAWLEMLINFFDAQLPSLFMEISHEITKLLPKIIQSGKIYAHGDDMAKDLAISFLDEMRIMLAVTVDLLFENFFGDSWKNNSELVRARRLMRSKVFLPTRNMGKKKKLNQSLLKEKQVLRKGLAQKGMHEDYLEKRKLNGDPGELL